MSGSQSQSYFILDSREFKVARSIYFELDLEEEKFAFEMKKLSL